VPRNIRASWKLCARLTHVLRAQIGSERQVLEAQLALERGERAAEAAAAAAAECSAHAEREDALRAAAQRSSAMDAEVTPEFESRAVRKPRAQLTLCKHP